MYSRLVLQRKLRITAICWLTEREKDGVVQLSSTTDAKSGDNLFDIILSKHHATWVLDPSKMEDYETLPDFVHLDIIKEIVKQVAWQLSGSAGLGGWMCKPSNDACCTLVAPAKNSGVLWPDLLAGRPTIFHLGPHTKHSRLDNSSHWISAQESVQLALASAGTGSMPSACFLSMLMRQKKHVS
jgi:hypothetical protein